MRLRTNRRIPMQLTRMVKSDISPINLSRFRGQYLKRIRSQWPLFNARQLVSASLALGMLGIGVVSVPTASAQNVPNDATATSAVSPATFNSWFKSGAVTLNGEVNP